MGPHGGRGGAFRLLLLSAAQVGTPQASERIERLPLLDGQGKVALVFLLAGKNDRAAFMALQLQYALPPPLEILEAIQDGSRFPPTYA